MLTMDEINGPYPARMRAVEREVRAALANLEPGIAISTYELNLLICPPNTDPRTYHITGPLLSKLADNLPGLAIKLPGERVRNRVIRRNSWVHVPLDRPHAPPKLPSQLDRMEQQLTRIEAMLLTLTMEGKTL